MRTPIRLRDECCNRNARISAKKAQLVERLEAYDRNPNFTKQDYVSPSFEMEIPESTLCKDLHGDVNIPSISLDFLQTYLKTADTTMDSKAKNLYDEQFLMCFRFAKKMMACTSKLDVETK